MTQQCVVAVFPLKTENVWCCTPYGCAGEPQLIPKSGAAAEDEGVVLSMCVAADGKAFVLFMDAASWKELGRAELPYSTPTGFTGSGWEAGRRVCP